ncbi:MAG: protease complex subunit PrcB family protein [Actinomycetota bacterium]|nr:protease complex subunit PrcB family protein [Actinomycetota bacterium]MDQ2981285.1 protease complex subunit PrcB family protein [Actinomycetota bacterium]
MVAVVLLAAGGWLLYTQAWTGETKPVVWSDLTPQLGTIEFTRKVTAVYHSRRPFVKLLEATMPGRAPEPPPHNWERDQVVVIALGPRSSAGYSLRILRVVERRRGIYVYAREETPALGDPVKARVTYPYRVLSMHGSAKPVYVKLEGRP